MEDRTFLTNNHPTDGISDTFRKFIEALVEEVVINGEPFDAQKKWLRKYSEAEGVDYEALERNLHILFEAIDELEEYESKSMERLLEFFAQDYCYLSVTELHKYIDYAGAIRAQKETERKPEKLLQDEVENEMGKKLLTLMGSKQSPIKTSVYKTPVIVHPPKEPLRYPFVIKNGEVSAYDITVQGNIEIPAVINGQKVTAIAEGAFSDCTKLVSVVIPNTAVAVGQYAFLNCSRLESVSIPNSVVDFARNAFKGCGELRDVTIGHENYRKIKDYLPSSVFFHFID